MPEEIRKRLDTGRIYLFGSHAYDTASADSDADICVIIPNSTPRPLDAIGTIRRAVYDEASSRYSSTTAPTSTLEAAPLPLRERYPETEF